MLPGCRCLLFHRCCRRCPPINQSPPTHIPLLLSQPPTQVWSGSKVAVLDADEQRFLEAQLAYNRGAPIMSDAAFDGLKAQLKAANSVVSAGEWREAAEAGCWQGSQRSPGGQLRPGPFSAEPSVPCALVRPRRAQVAAEGPRCSISSRKMYSDASVDYLKMVR